MNNRNPMSSKLKEQEPDPSFEVRGIKVKMISPVTASVIINVPWPKEHVPRPDEENFVHQRVRWVIEYCVAEELFGGRGMGIMVITDHKSQDNQDF